MKIIISLLVSLFIFWNFIAYGFDKSSIDEDLCSIIQGNTTLVKIIWNYAIYNNEIYIYEPYLNWNTGKMVCETSKI